MNAPTPVPQPVMEPRPQKPKAPPAPYDYEYITDTRANHWSDTGRQDVISAGVRAREEDDIMVLATIFQELIRATLDGRIQGLVAGEAVKEILGPDTTTEDPSAATDLPALFLDTLSLIADSESYDHALRDLAVTSGVSPMLMRQQLDASLLESLGLTRSTFFKVGIRKVTNLLYRQANYNLLREETEGYSKLVTELFTTSGREPPSREVVEDSFERLKGLIGTFDLDVGRVLDVTLDVFGAVLIKHNRFFIKLLRVSSWWPREQNIDSLAPSGEKIGGLPKWALPESAGWTNSEEDEQASALQREARDLVFWDRAREIGIDAFFELGGRRVADIDSALPATGDDEDVDSLRAWVKATGTLPPCGNRIAAQLLGFKLRFYASDARDETDVLPNNLIYLAAVLIKIGFISLRDLYPHLYPLDDAMEGVREERMKEIADKERQSRPGGGAKNALMMAGALADDTVPAPRTRLSDRNVASEKPDPAATEAAEPEPKDKLPLPADQKVQLLKSLLTIGAIPESLFMLGRFPWLPEAFPELLDLIHRVLHHSIDKVYKDSRPVSTEDATCPPKRPADFDQNGVPKGHVRQVDIPVRKPLRWAFADRHDNGEGISYRFYWDEWADNVPVCQNVDDIFTLCKTFLNYSGVNIGRDVSLLSKFASIGTQSLATDHSVANLERWQDLLKRLLVPALSMTRANTSIVNEVFEMLRYYPGPVRYNIYAEWFEGQTSRLPAIKSAFENARLETIATMKRISKTNIPAMARALAKIAFASPGIVFKVAITHMEAYKNLIEVVVECAKYFTDLGYDVLIWSLISSLGGNRSRMQDEGLFASQWLQALASFSGKVFKKYSIMDLSPVLRYVNDQLTRGNATDLRVLEEIMMQMAGVVPNTDFTEAQLTAMTGGEVLKRQTLINLQDKRFELTKTAKRLLQALVHKNLAAQLLLSIAQQRQAGIFAVPDENAHIKFLASMIDDLQRVFLQYLDLLRSNLTPPEFDALIPDVTDLMSEYGLDPILAFEISRPGLAHRMAAIQLPSSAPSRSTPSVEEHTKTDVEGDSAMKTEDSEIVGAGTVEPVGNSTVSSPEQVETDNIQMDDVADETSSSLVQTNPWNEVLNPIKTAVVNVLPETTWETLSPEFFVTFWQLSLSDIQIPSQSYEAEISRLMKEQSDLMKDRSDMTRAGMNRKEEAKKHLSDVADKLRAELKQQIDIFEVTSARLAKEKLVWFADCHGRWDALNIALLEHCLIPRAMLSPSDGQYAARMIKYLHSAATPNFRTAGLLGQLFRPRRLRSIIFSCTTREAESFGRFLKEILKDLSRWHADKVVFEKEAHGPKSELPGFGKLLDKSGNKAKSLFGYEDFRTMLWRFHQSLNTALRLCITGMEWTQIRNSITILKAVHEYFPAVDFMGKQFYETLLVIGKRERAVRPDLFLAANALLADLKKREKTWVMKQAFSSLPVS
jgi:THO complex subunit 2